MADHTIFTPFFLDESLPGLEPAYQPQWQRNQPPLPEGGQQQRMAAIYEPLARAVAAAIDRGERPVSVAGDCCATLGMLAGLQRAGVDPQLIWFDAHGDFNTPETSPSGFLGGMPLAMLVGRGDLTMPNALNLKPLPENQVILTDARDLDPGERELVEQASIIHLKSAHDLLRFPLSGRPIYIHFDVDILDPQEAPAMSYPVPGGISAEDLRTVFARLMDTNQVAAVSMSCWNPAVAGADKTRQICMGVFSALL